MMQSPPGSSHDEMDNITDDKGLTNAMKRKA